MKTYMILSVPYLAGALFAGFLLCSVLCQIQRIEKESTAFSENLLAGKVRVVKINDIRETVRVQKGEPTIVLNSIITKKMLHISGDTLYLDGRYKPDVSVIIPDFQTLISNPGIETVIAERSGVVIFGNDTIR